MPDFIIIGAAKAGTSTLYHLLAQHPQIYMSPIKEPGFFAEDEVYARGLEWYKSLFASADEKQICGEASTQYTRYPQLPHTAERVAETLPKAKLIYIMREPISRAYSHYFHRYERELFPNQPIEWSFEKHVEYDPICLDSNDYRLQLTQYLEYFDRDAILPLLFEDLVNNFEHLANQLSIFLDIDPAPLREAGRAPVHNQASRFRESRVRMSLANGIQRLPGARRVGRTLPRPVRRGVRNVLVHLLKRTPVGKYLSARYEPKPMARTTEKNLQDRFAESNQWIADWLDRDLHQWTIPGAGLAGTATNGTTN